MEKTIIVVAGPTAVGKTKFAIDIANRLDGEIVSADSMQLYKYMNIGSAKPTKEEMSMAKHHLVDEIDPKEPFSVVEYQKRAKIAINDIFARSKQPIISGGTGLYINSLIYNMDFSAPPVENSYRKELEKIAEEKGCLYLHEVLKKYDSLAAERIHPNNLKKVIRALEVSQNYGEGIKPFTESFVKTKDYDVIMLCLIRDREILYDRINQRVDILMDMGLVEEIKGLMKMGLTEDNISMKGIGYKEIIGYLNGEYELDEAVNLVKRNSRRYAKRQITWFKRYEDMKWFDLSSYENDQVALEDILSWLPKNE